MNIEHYFTNDFEQPLDGEDINSVFLTDVNNNLNLNMKNEEISNNHLDKNPIQFKNDIFPENTFINDFPQINPISMSLIRNDDESSNKKISDNNFSSNSNSIINAINSSFDKESGIKKNQKNNEIVNKNFIFILNKDSNNNKITNKEEKQFIDKKRRPRIHLEDLNIDPEIIKNKKFQVVGNKVILSKNQKITEEDRKEIRRIRNMISAKNSRNRKKAEFNDLQEKIKKLTDELMIKKIIIENYEKNCCSSCKSRIWEINKKLTEDNYINDNIISSLNEEKNEDLIPEEDDSFFSNKNNLFCGKLSSVLVGVVCIIAIIVCIVEGGIILINKNKLSQNQNLVMTNSYQGTLRHLINNICLKEDENNISINFEDDDNNNKNNVPLPVKNFINNNLLQMCHDNFTKEIYFKLKNTKEKKNGNFLRKEYNRESICLQNNSVVNNNYIINNNYLPIEANKLILNDKLSNKIISVFVKDYESLKRYLNGRVLPLQEQIENEAKNSEDGCVYLQMIIPKETIKSSCNKNGTYSEYENDFFEIRCKIFAYNNYYEQGMTSH